MPCGCTSLTESNLVTSTVPFPQNFQLSSHHCLFLSPYCSTHASHLYTSVGITTSFYPVLSSWAPCSQAPINVTTLPILLSNSFSIPPFPHRLTPRYTICFACSNCTVPPPLYTQRVPCMFVFPSLFLNLFIESFHVLTYMSSLLSWQLKCYFWWTTEPPF